MKSEEEIRERLRVIKQIDEDLWKIAGQYTPEAVMGWMMALKWVLEEAE